MAGRTKDYIEIEGKLSVPLDFTMPPISAAGGPPGDEIVLESEYHDSADLRLLRWGLTVRRRFGGSDEGWHVKIPRDLLDTGARDELRFPVDGRGDVSGVPAVVARVVSPLLREAPLEHLITLRTRRRSMALRDGHGAQVADLSDDHVEVIRAGSVTAAFREIELEANPEGDADAQPTVTRTMRALLEAGGVQHLGTKLERALGPAANYPPDVVVPDPPKGSDPAAAALHHMIAGYVRALLFLEVDVRRGKPDSVHQLRVAARSLRSILRIYGKLFDEDWSRSLSGQLKAASDALREARDLEVQLERLGQAGRSLPEPHRSAVGPFVAEVLGHRQHMALETLCAHLDSSDHQRLLIQLVQAARDPRFSPRASQRARSALPRLLKRAGRRLDRHACALEPQTEPDQWHKVRIRAKRVRYAAKAARDLLPDPMKATDRSLKKVTNVLGDHQDAQVSQRILSDLAASSGHDGIPFALGVMAEREAERAREDRQEFFELWLDTRQRLLGRTGARHNR